MSSWEVRGKLRGVWRLLLMSIMSTYSVVGKASSTLQPLITFNFHFLKSRKNTEKLKQNSWKIIVPRSTLRKYLWYSDHIVRNFIDELNSTWKLVAFYFRGLRQNPGPCNLSRPWIIDEISYESRAYELVDEESLS